MAAKLCVLAAVTLLLSVSASADSNSASQVLVKELWKLAPGTAEGDAIDVKSLEETVTNMMLNKGEGRLWCHTIWQLCKKDYQPH
jgi:hypothetical protein